DLRDGKRTVEFNVTCRLNAVFTLSESAARFSFSALYETKAVQELSGTGGAFRWDLTGAGGALHGTQLTRHQKRVFQGKLRTEVIGMFHIEDPKDLEFLDAQLKRYADNDKLFGTQPINPRKAFAKDLSNLSSYGFKPTDLEPDVLTQL